MGHAHLILEATKYYEVCCAEFSDKCTKVINGEAKNCFTKYKITESFWLLSQIHRRNSTELMCAIWRGSYKGKLQGTLISHKSLAQSVIDFPELKKAVWFEEKWPSLEELGYT